MLVDETFNKKILQNRTVIIDSVVIFWLTITSTLFISFCINQEMFSRVFVYEHDTRGRLVFYVCVCVKENGRKKIRLLPPVVTIIVTITPIHFLSLSLLLYRQWRLQLLCVTHIPCFWKGWWKNARTHNGREVVVSVSALFHSSFIRSFVVVRLAFYWSCWCRWK